MIIGQHKHIIGHLNKNIMKDRQLYFNIGFSLLLVLIFMQTCGVKKTIKKVEKVEASKLSELESKLDSLSELVITEEHMIEIIEETPAWKTLRIEEISDKERISINALEEKTE